MSDAKVIKQYIPQAATASKDQPAASRSKPVKATPFLLKSLSFAAPSTRVALPAAISNLAKFYTGMEDYSRAYSRFGPCAMDQPVMYFAPV
jgi:hypothetical protein